MKQKVILHTSLLPPPSYVFLSTIPITGYKSHPPTSIRKCTNILLTKRNEEGCVWVVGIFKDTHRCSLPPMCILQQTEWCIFMMMFNVIHIGRTILHESNKKKGVWGMMKLKERKKKLFQVYVLELRLINLSRKTNLHNMKIFIFFFNKQESWILIVWLCILLCMLGTQQ